MSRIICTSTVEVKRNRVAPARALPFGSGILDPVEELISAGKASRLPTVEGRGLSSAEHAVINGEVNAARHEAEGWARGLDRVELTSIIGQVVEAARRNAFKAVLDARPKLQPIVPARPAPAIARGFIDFDGVYVPSAAELDAWYTVLDRDEALSLDRELDQRYAEHVAYERMMAGQPDEMLAIGACG
jgi:hypothetical protein